MRVTLLLAAVCVLLASTHASATPMALRLAPSADDDEAKLSALKLCKQEFTQEWLVQKTQPTEMKYGGYIINQDKKNFTVSLTNISYKLAGKPVEVKEFTCKAERQGGFLATTFVSTPNS